MPQDHNAAGPLQGLRILDLSTLVAGPFASTVLADLGADVLKVEIPGIGDALRALPPHKEGVSLWWKVTNRNKRGITIDLRHKEGQKLIAKMLPDYDVLVENFRPGTLAGWGITKDWLHNINPRLTILRVTGFGQTGPYRNRPGFARIFEAMTGFTNICGSSDGPPLHIGFPVADAVAGLFGAIGILSALHYQNRSGDTAGQEIDCSLAEAMLRILDFMPIEYDQLGIVRQRSGNTSQHAAPGNVYKTREGQWASIAASTQSIYERLCAALNRHDLIDDQRFKTNQLRVANREVLDDIIKAEIGARTLDELSAVLGENQVGFSPIYDIADVFKDPHFAARRTLVQVHDEELGPVRMQCVVPILSHTPGHVHHAGPSIGQHNDPIFRKLGLDAKEIEQLRTDRVI